MDRHPTPPRADRRQFSFTVHGQTIDDPYAWLKDPGYPEVTDKDVLAYLEAENGYFEGVMAPLKPLVDTIFEELKGRVQQDDASVPAPDGDFEYWWRFEPGQQYRRWLRRPVGGGGPATED
jgi:oligopeptidase B